MANPIDNTEEIIDSREVIERIEELEALQEQANDPEETDEGRQEAADEFDQAEYDALIAFRDSGADLVSDWEYGETFVHEDYFEDYVRDLMIDCGYIPTNLPEWIVIDWQETADNLREDYADYEFDGVTYWARA